MEVFVLHILKLNMIAAVVILLVRILAILFKGRVSARWKYFIWLLLAVTLCAPVRLPANLALVDVKVQSNSQRDVQEPETENHTVRSGKGQKITETVSSSNSNRKSMTEIPEQKRTVMWESDKWMEIVTVIFVTVWLSVAVLKMAGELLAYCLSMKKLERMSLPVSDPVSIQMYREVCRRRQIRRIPELRQNAGLTTPLLAGLFHTKLYLPAAGYSAEERKLVFYHELTHYCHRDLWYKMLLRICASIYWFNPFLLIMLKEADKDIENLCDTEVVHRVNKKEHKLYRQLLLRTVAMNSQIPYVTASLNDSGMVFKDRILYMVNIQKLRRGILPGVLLAVLLVGGNLVFTVSVLPVGTGTSAQGNSDGAADDDIPYPDFAPFSELVDMQNAPAISDGQAGAGNAEDVSGVAENLQDNASNRMESTAGALTGSETTTDSVSPSTEDRMQDNTDSTDSGNTGENTDNIDHYAHLPAGVPYTSGYSSASGVASIVAPGEDENDARVLHDNGDGTYSDEIGFTYSYQGDGTWADAYGNSYRTWNDEDYNFGNQLEHHELQSSSGSVDVKETTNGDYYYRDSDGVGYTDNGDGTWTDENGNTYTE